MKLLPGLLFATVAVVASGSLRAQGPGASAHPLEPTIASGGEVAATTGVEVWLAIVDDGRYPDSWQSAASIFKNTVPEEGWVTILKDHRQALGKVLSRHIRSRQYSKTLPGAPAGQYVSFLYDTSFENRKAAVETVTCVLDVDGQWRVTGYFVH